MNTYLGSGMDDSSTGAVADKRSTIADTDANTYELPPSLLLLYRPGLNSVLAL